ncbi:MAG: hypothetical protein ABI127_04610 [Dokdonella sp.]
MTRREHAPEAAAAGHPIHQVQREFNALHQDCTGRAELARPNETPTAEMIANPGRIRLSALATALAVLVLSAAALAQEITVQEAVEQVQRETTAKVLSVQTLNIGKRKIYRIKILTSGGQVRVLEIKADQ